MNRWGNSDHGPGGDPSWLGGKDRGGGDAADGGSGGWSSDFSSDFSRGSSTSSTQPESDFSRGDAGFTGRAESPDAEQMAPRFGDRSDGDVRSSEGSGDSPWSASFTGQESAGSGSRKSGLSKALGAAVPILAVLIIGIVAVNVVGGFGDGFGGFGFMWMFLFFGIPLISKVIRAIRKNLDD